MRYSQLLAVLITVLLPVTCFADDQDLGPAIYLNDPVAASHQVDDDWDNAPVEASASASNRNTFSIVGDVPVKNKSRPVKKSFYGPTKRKEHIWAIAQKLKPNAAITMQQMIIALQRANPSAFNQNNINALKHGSRLRIPSLAQITAISPELADKLVAEQNAQWRQQWVNVSKPSDPITQLVMLAKNEANQNNTIQNNVIAKPLNSKPPVSLAQSAAPILMPIPPVNKTAPAAIKPPIVLEESPKLTMPDLEKKTAIAPIKPPVSQPNPQLKTELQLAAAEKELQDYRSKAEQRDQQLLKQNAVMQQQLVNENKEVKSLQTELAAVKTKPVEIVASQAASKPGFIVSKNSPDYLPKSKGAWWIITGAIFLIVLLWLPYPRKKEIAASDRQEPVLTDDADYKDIKDEYDFMNSQEAVPAKLDLARAYIDMEDHVSADAVLKEVLNKGNETERKRAKQLLREVKI